MQVRVQDTQTHIVWVAFGVVRVGDASGVTAETGVEGSLVRLGVEASARAENKDNLLFQTRLDLIPGFFRPRGSGKLHQTWQVSTSKKKERILNAKKLTRDTLGCYAIPLDLTYHGLTWKPRC